MDEDVYVGTNLAAERKRHNSEKILGDPPQPSSCFQRNIRSAWCALTVSWRSKTRGCDSRRVLLHGARRVCGLTGEEGSPSPVYFLLSRLNPLRFRALVGAALPPDSCTLRLHRWAIESQRSMRSRHPQPKSKRQFRLREVAGPALDHARLPYISGEDLNRRADGIAIRFRADQLNPNALIPRELIVAIEVCRTVVGGDQQDRGRRRGQNLRRPDRARLWAG